MNGKQASFLRRSHVRRVYAVPLACLFAVTQKDTPMYAGIGIHSGNLCDADGKPVILSLGVSFHGLRWGEWVQRLPSLGGGFVEAACVREID